MTLALAQVQLPELRSRQQAAHQGMLWQMQTPAKMYKQPFRHTIILGPTTKQQQGTLLSRLLNMEASSQGSVLHPEAHGDSHARGVDRCFTEPDHGEATTLHCLPSL
ncbi:hypothetical protein WJX72_001021 [[Myrmecia] bisecta]|uniref:Uncharacterized protein n=1 Tax=[Myrmecia] bisecta TaxID=41462 RepID=A0AAW1P9T7_9CHLO